MPRFSSPCKPGLMTSAFWFSQITMTLMSRRSLSMRRCLLFWEEDRDSTHTRVYLRFPFSHPTNMGVSSFTRAWSDCVGNPGFDKRSTWHDNSLTKGSMVGGGVGGGHICMVPQWVPKGPASNASRKPLGMFAGRGNRVPPFRADPSAPETSWRLS